MFYGRQSELDLLNDKYTSLKSELVVVYGRRRVGKSKLLTEFCKQKRVFSCEGLEGERTPQQIKHFAESMKEQLADPALDGILFSNWKSVFSYLTQWIIREEQRTVLVFDEFQWMAAGRTSLVSLIKFFWDNHWKEKNVLLILCGSIASFMVEQVIRSNSLYGRITLELLVKGLSPREAQKMFREKRSTEEVLKYLMIFGGIPKYLEEINLNASFEKNMNSLCFSKTGIMTHEFDRIFYNQFKEPNIYLKIVRTLNNRLLSLQELSEATSLPSGGGLQSYLRHLEEAEFIRSFIPINKSARTKIRKYRLVDEYLVFYLKFIEPLLRTIQDSSSHKIFEMHVKPKWTSWLGFAFERFCIKNASHIAKILSFSDEVKAAAPYFGKSDVGFQIDLLFERSDQVYTLCEIKYYDQKVGTSVIPEVKRKVDLFPLPSGYTLETVLISPFGPDRPLRDADFFHHFVDLGDFFG